MTSAEILKNIYSFVEVLQAASGVEAASWNDEDFANAVNWAKYCEEVMRIYVWPYLFMIVLSHNLSQKDFLFIQTVCILHIYFFVLIAGLSQV